MIRQSHKFVLFAALLSMSISACAERRPVNPRPEDVSSSGSAGKAKSTPERRAAPTERPKASPWYGKIAETMDSGGYSYVLMDTGVDKKWIAGPAVAGLEVGQKVSVAQPMEMRDFESGTLKRKFDVIYFVGAIRAEGAGATTAPHGAPTAPHGGAVTKPADSSGGAPANKSATKPLAKAEGGYTVAEVFAKKAELNGKSIKVRGRVVKFMPNIMGTNWLHIEDGSGSGATARLRVTTSATPGVGDVVVVEGTMTADKDLGSGYSYAALIEKATVTKE